MTSNPLRGGCQCGAVRFSAGAPLAAYCCHCTECQAQSASAFGISVVVSSESLEVEGETASWLRDRGLPSEVRCTFCSTCGTRLFHSRDGTDRTTIKGGALDHRGSLEPDGHIWLASAMPWIRRTIICDTEDCFEGQPPDYRGLIDRWAERGRATRTLLDERD